MIHDLSRLPIDYQRFCHYARSFCTFDWRLLGIDRIDYFPMTEGVGASHPAGHQTGGPVVALRINDPNLRSWRKDYLGRQAPWQKPNDFRAKIYQKLGAGEWTIAVDLHEALGHMLGFFIVGQSIERQQRLVDIYGMEQARTDHHVWIPAVLKAFTPLYIPEVTAELAAKVKAVVTQ